MGFAAIALTLCVVTNIIIACENVEAIPPFYARKIVHIASGIVLALINPTGASSSFIAIVFVSIVLLRVSVTPFRYSLTRSSPHTALLFILYHQPLCQPLFPRPPLTHLNPHSPHPNILSRFCQRGDIGITVYGIVVCCWCLMGLPFRYLTPMFFADPMAAVVGRSVKPEVRWYKNKTVSHIIYLRYRAISRSLRWLVRLHASLQRTSRCCWGLSHLISIGCWSLVSCVGLRRWVVR
eukprot:GHVN01013092.1.p1 GENE.GHVN01013092.1~~GHVN01013092.1.p1  ORF type:complete len:237 (-),score=26.66 GHVN01013092.1:375-1085(-)